MKRKVKELIDKYKNTNIIFKATLWYTICSILQKGISLITMPIFTRLMTTGQFGQYSIFLTWYNIINIIVTLNIQSEIFNKGLIDHSSEMEKYSANQVGLVISLSGLWTAIYLVFSRYLNFVLDVTISVMLAMIVQMMSEAIIGIWSAQQRFRYKYKAVVLQTLFVAVLTPLIGIFMVLSTNQKAQAKIFSNAIGVLVVAIFLLVGYAKKYSFIDHFDWWKKAVFSAIPLVPHYLSLVVLNQSDKLMIDHYIGKKETALYSVAHTVGLLMTIVNGSINGAFVPWAYEKMKNDEGIEIRNISNKLLEIVVIVNLCLIWCGPEIIKIVAAPQYKEAVWCLIPIAISVFFYFAYTLFVDVEIYYGENKYVAIASLCAAILNIVLNIIFIPMVGYIAAAYTTLFGYFFTMILHYIFYKITMKKNDNLTKIYSMKAVCFFSLILISLSIVAGCLYKYVIIRYMIITILVVMITFNYKSILNLVVKLKWVD